MVAGVGLIAMGINACSAFSPLQCCDNGSAQSVGNYSSSDLNSEDNSAQYKTGVGLVLVGVVLLLAPTGKSAYNLSKLLKKSGRDYVNFA